MTHREIEAVTDRIRQRSRGPRQDWLSRMRAARAAGPGKLEMSCGNLAHAIAACPAADKEAMTGGSAPNIGIVTAFNDMLSAHQPFEVFPDIIKKAAHVVGATAQVAGGVPAMCDGVTQGQDGMELSLFSREVIAMATAIALSHNVFDGALCLGVCDKIVPGLVIGALSFAHLPIILVPAGPMPSGLPNPEKARVRQEYAAGKVGKDELLQAESASYHAPGTCTFYGTANSNQMLMEVMGLHLPGSAFIPPGTDLRTALTEAAARRVVAKDCPPLFEVLDERSFVNAIVGLHATGGSTNHTLHLTAMARAAGITLTWQDFDDLAKVTPLLTRIYPNGSADVNHFHQVGGLAFVIRELLSGGLLHADAMTVSGAGLAHMTQRPVLSNGALEWEAAPSQSGNLDILRPLTEPFASDGGLKVLNGRLGQSVIKVSAVKPEHRFVRAPARVFHSQQAMLDAFKAGELIGDFVAVLRFQGPRSNGMPELHKLTPTLAVCQDRGQKVALVTDGRMSGASGKVPAAIHVSPEAAMGGPLAKVQDGDMMVLDAENGTLEVEVEDAQWQARAIAPLPNLQNTGLGRELFSVFRNHSSSAETGASSLLMEPEVFTDE